MKSKKIGLYVHIPFGLKKCNYGDFCSFANLPPVNRERYIDRLCEEIVSYKGKLDTYQVESIFFGGGTPSLLSKDEFEKIVGAIREILTLDDTVEFTLEANPKTLTKENLSVYVSHGVNRLSVGLQSIHENELKVLGRIHDLEDFRTSLDLILNSGIQNINVDIMYAIPQQSAESFRKTVDFVSTLPITHISAYSLIIEEDTPFGRMKDNLPLPTEEEELLMVEYLHQKMKENGFVHYEISNYSKVDTPSRHNLLYWNMDEYIGVGISAHSDFSGVRFSNTSSLDEYISEEYIQYRMSETPKEEERAFEYAMLRLRLKEGLSLSEYEKRFHLSFLENKEEYIQKCIEGGYLILEGDNLSFSEEGFYVSNEILSMIL